MRLRLIHLGGAFAIILTASSPARPQSCTLTNPTGKTYENEVLRLGISLPGSAKQGDYQVLVDGKEVIGQVGHDEGRAWMYVVCSLAEDESVEYSLKRGRPKAFKSLVTLKQEGETYVLDNGQVAVRVPAAAKDATPAPILSVRGSNGKWVGKGLWQTERELKKFSAEVLGSGPLFAKVRLKYEFEGNAGLYKKAAASAVVDVAAFAHQQHVVIEEAHEMQRGDFWEFDAAAGWKPRSAICIPHSGGFERPDFGPWPPNSLKAGQTRMGDKLLNLMPRWTQAYDEGWFFACHDGRDAVGAMVCRAGKWHWPHNNMLEVLVRPSAYCAGLRCPTWKGRRCWYLVAGPAKLWADDGAKDYARAHAFEPLDKLHHDYVLDWPGLEKLLSDGKKPPKLGSFWGQDFFSSGMNPTGAMRGFGKGAVRNIGKPGNLSTLTHVQVLFDNDCYGSYWNYWSPENPNFFTDFMRGPIAMTTQLQKHPRFKEWSRLAEQKFREDLYHSVTSTRVHR